DFCLPVSREMRVGAFTRERYLALFPYGTRAAEFRRDLGLVIAERPLKADAHATRGAYYRRWIERKKPPFVRVSRARDYRQHFTTCILAFSAKTSYSPIRRSSISCASARTSAKCERSSPRPFTHTRVGTTNRARGPARSRSSAPPAPRGSSAPRSP